MSATNLLLVINDLEEADQEIRRETFMGDDYLAAPVTAAKAMELNGGYVPQAEWVKSAAAWNGTPITLSHPVDSEGRPLLANIPDVAESTWFGFLFNVVATNEGERLDGEVWLNVDRARALSDDAMAVIDRVANGDSVEVSTAYFADRLPAGEYDGSEYELVVGNLRPEHLAMLPNEIGKCSVADGCGTPSPSMTAQNSISDIAVGDSALLVSNAASADTGGSEANANTLVDNNTTMPTNDSDGDTPPVEDANSVSTDPSPIGEWLERGRNLLGVGSANDTTRNESDDEITNEPAESGMDEDEPTIENMDSEKRNTLIDALVENHGFTQESAEALGDNCLKLTHETFENKESDEPPTDGGGPETVQNDDNPTDDPTDFDEFADSLLNRFEERMDSKLQEYERSQNADTRAHYIGTITQNSDFEEAELNSRSTDELRKMAEALTPAQNTATFAAVPAGGANGGSNDELEKWTDMVENARGTPTIGGE